MLNCQVLIETLPRKNQNIGLLKMNWKSWKHLIQVVLEVKYFEEDGAQNYLLFQPMYKYLKKGSNTDNISEWKSKRLSHEVIKPPDNSLAPTLGYHNKKTCLEFNGVCLKQDKITYNHGKIVTIYIVYDLKSTLKYDENFTLEICLFGAVKFTKNVDVDKYKYCGYGIGFDGKGGFHAQLVILVLTQQSLEQIWVHLFILIIQKKLILGKGPTQGLRKHSFTAEKIYSINFSATKRALFEPAL